MDLQAGRILFTALFVFGLVAPAFVIVNWRR